MIRLANQGSFVSGSADLQSGFMPLLRKSEVPFLMEMGPYSGKSYGQCANCL